MLLPRSGRDDRTHAAAGFQALGVKKGVKVGLFLPNCPQHVVCYYGILKAGGTVVNFSPLYSEPELLHQIEDSQTDIMVTLNLTVLYPKMLAMLEKSRLKKLVVGTMPEVLSFPKNLLFPLARAKDVAKTVDDSRHVSFKELLNNDGTFEPPEIDPTTDIAVLQYTGGTTGVAKGAMLTHANLYANAVQAAMWFTMVEPGQERMLSVLPFFHVFAMTVCMNMSFPYRGRSDHVAAVRVGARPQGDQQKEADDAAWRSRPCTPRSTTSRSSANTISRQSKGASPARRRCHWRCASGSKR